MTVEMPTAMADLLSLIEQDIPAGRKNLEDSHENLKKVADYCETNYFQADDKKAALEETKNFTTQSLASVAYQINTLAYNVLHMLDLQATQMADMESQINHISQTVSIHKEKVARREIGILTNNKSNPRDYKILVPANPERQAKYSRKPIDYSILDDVGHGVKITAQNQLRKRGSLPNGHPVEMGGSHYMSGHLLSGPAPTTKPPTPPTHSGSKIGLGTLSRGSKEYRAPAPPAPPQVPSNYAPNYPLGHPRRGSAYGTLPRGAGSSISGESTSQYQSGSMLSRQTSIHSHHSQNSTGSYSGHPTYSSQETNPYHSGQPQQPQVGMVHPMSQQHSQYQPTLTNQMQHQQQPQSYTSPSPPPPPPLPTSGTSETITSNDSSLPAPPVNLNSEMSIGANQPTGGAVHHQPHHPMHGPSMAFDRNSTNSPPLPPPPPDMDQANEAKDWIPRTYLEKVKAVYDYTANRYDELSFQENSIIYVIKKNDDGWYEGVLNGITGLFPGNYVESCL